MTYQPRLFLRRCLGKNCPQPYYEDDTAYLDSNILCSSCCPAGRDNHQECMRLDPESPSWKKDFRTIFEDYYVNHCVQYHGYPPRTHTHTGNGAPTGAFAFTLTASPTDGLTEADMVSAVRKIMHQKSCPVKSYAWYLEYKDAEAKTHPHIHGMYETEKGGVIEKKHFQRAWKIWDPSQRLGLGFRGGYHRPVRDDEKYDTYIKKQNILGESRA